MAETGMSCAPAAREVDRRRRARASSKGKRRSRNLTIREILQQLAPELKLTTNYPYAGIAQAAKEAGMLNRSMLADAFKVVSEAARLDTSITASYAKAITSIDPAIFRQHTAKITQTIASLDPAIFQPHTARIAKAVADMELQRRNALADAIKMADDVTRRTSLVASVSKMIEATRTNQANYVKLTAAALAAEQAARIAKIAQPNLKIYNTVMKLDSMFKGFPPRQAS
jgi:hypothetical protein